LTLVLLPGLDGTGALFEPLLDSFGGHPSAKIIAYPPGKPLGLAELGAHVERELPVGEVSVLAESFSSLVALRMLAGSSARFKAIIFVGGFGEPPRPLLLRLAPLLSLSPRLMKTAPAFLLRQYCLGGEASAADLSRLRKALATVSPEVLAQRLGIVASRHDFGRGAFDLPCCYLRATQDRLVPATATDWFRKRFRNFEVEDLDGPHFLLQARPDDAVRSIRGFLDRHGIVAA
jgi:pimeloyl-[acyl-carrier protein] methyl ester esterase